MQTVGEFLLAKLCNMAAWIEREADGRCDGIAARVRTLTPLQAIVFAQYVKSAEEAVQGRDWSALQAQLGVETNPAAVEMCGALRVVRESVAMHDKFWRYMQLLCSAA
jgi:hypothetical protein